MTAFMIGSSVAIRVGRESGNIHAAYVKEFGVLIGGNWVCISRNTERTCGFAGSVVWVV